MYVFTRENTDNQNTNTEISTKLVACLHVLIAWTLLKDLKQQNRGSETASGSPSLASYSCQLSLANYLPVGGKCKMVWFILTALSCCLS